MDSPWWVEADAVRNLVAAFAVVSSLAMVWWGWARLEPGPADLLTRTMVSVASGALGYLFGRGDVERVTRLAAEEHEGKVVAATDLDESQQALSHAKRASRMLRVLGEMAVEDERLAGKIDEARRRVRDDGDG